ARAHSASTTRSNAQPARFVAPQGDQARGLRGGGRRSGARGGGAGATVRGMRTYDKLYIDGTWVPSAGTGTLEVVNSATEEVMATIPEGTPADVDKAVAAARKAFAGWSQTSVDERAKYLTRIQEGLEARTEELATVIAQEVGMPVKLAQIIQAGLPKANFGIAAQVVQTFPFEETVGNSLVVREPIGVVGCITPWNYPLHQIALKVAPALAAGNTVV